MDKTSEMLTSVEREFVSWTESIGKVKEGSHRHSRRLFSSKGSTFKTLSACLFTLEDWSVGMDSVLSGWGASVPNKQIVSSY